MKLYNILNKQGDSCFVHLVKADTIKISRKPTKVFTFRDEDRFIDALIGHRSCEVYVGRNEEEEKETEKWYAYFWEGEEERSRDSYDSYGHGHATLPDGSLAILEMENEYTLEISLESRMKERQEYYAVFQEVKKTAGAINRLDRNNKYADPDEFKYMKPDELQEVLEEMKREYRKLESEGEVEI